MKITPNKKVNLTIACGFAALFTGAACAQSFTALDFSGPRTAITSAGNVTGYTFHNIFGDGSDASLDVVYNASYSTNQFFSVVNDRSANEFPTPRIAEVSIANADTAPPVNASSNKSLDIRICPIMGSEFTGGIVNARMDFFLHDSTGAGINNGTFRFITRDVDGGIISPDLFFYESLTLHGATGITVANPSHLSINGETISAPQDIAHTINVNPPSIDGTAYWYQSGSRWSWDLTNTYSGPDYGEYSNFIFDAGFQPIPEPSSAALLGFSGAAFLLLRRRRMKGE